MKDDTQNEAHKHRTTLNGCWILDKTREPWSMNDYLQTMNVDPLAIEAHEKGEKEYETYHTIEFINQNTGVRIIKRSRVNNDVVVELTLGQESRQYLQPNDRLKSSIATSDHLGHLCIKSSLVTTDNHGTAIVTDMKRLQHMAHPEATPITAVAADAPTEENPMMDQITDKNLEDVSSVPVTTTTATTTVVLVQELTIQNVETGQSHTTTRYFLPYDDTPPHLVVAAAVAATNTTASNQNAAEEDEDLMDDL